MPQTATPGAHATQDPTGGSDQPPVGTRAVRVAIGTGCASYCDVTAAAESRTGSRISSRPGSSADRRYGDLKRRTSIP
jgi:hypothetical protein